MGARRLIWFYVNESTCITHKRFSHTLDMYLMEMYRFLKKYFVSMLVEGYLNHDRAPASNFTFNITYQDPRIIIRFLWVLRRDFRLLGKYIYSTCLVTGRFQASNMPHSPAFVFLAEYGVVHVKIWFGRTYLSLENMSCAKNVQSLLLQ